MKLLEYFLKKYKRKTILVFLGVSVASVITAFTLLTLPALLAGMIGRHTSKAEFMQEIFSNMGINPTTGNLVLFLTIGIVAQNLILGASKTYAGFTVAKIVKDLRIQLLTSMSGTEWKYFTRHSSGAFAATLVNEANKAGDGYMTSVELTSLLVQIVAYLSVAFFISWKIAVIAIITSILLTAAFSKLISASKKLGMEDNLLIRKITSQVTDSYRSIKPLKAMARENHANALLESYTKQLRKVTKKTTFISEILASSQEIILMLSIIFTIYYSFKYLSLPLELSAVLVILYLRSMRLVGKAQKQLQTFAGNVDGFERIVKSIEIARQNREKRDGKLTYIFTKNIQFKNVSYSYGEKKVLENFNAEIKHNKLNSIVGPSGAGKTTVIDLICSMYKPDSGEILVDDINLNDIEINCWRKQIGYVGQENNLLNTTVRENITLGDSEISIDNINAALSNAQAWKFVNNLEDGIDTTVGENGTRLSGGQRQRILIARALVNSPSLLILDEATSALDKETEQNISKVFKEISKNTTIISISHRPALADISDHIIHLEPLNLTGQTEH